MSRLSIALAAVGTATIALPATAAAATLSTDRQCYIERQPMQVTGSGWPAGAPWSIQAEQLFDSGTADAAGTFVSTAEVAPIIPESTTKPRTFTLTGASAGQTLATTTFRVVNLYADVNLDGRPTATTSWRFSGLMAGRSIFVHVRRGGRTWTVRAGKAQGPCGTLSTRLRRLPGVPANRIRTGTYKIAVDNRRKYRKGGIQLTTTLRIFLVPAR